MKKIFMAAFLACFTMFGYAQSRSALVHLKSGKVVEYDVDDIDSINFTDPVTYDELIEDATYGMGVYFGNGEYLTQISNAPMDSDGLPTQAGQYILRFMAISDNSTDSNHAILPSGRYTPASDFSKGSLYDNSDYLIALVCTRMENGQPMGYSVYFDKGATANVTYNSDGTYDIDFKGSVSPDSADFENLRMRFHGTIDFANNDPSYYNLLDEDVNMVPAALSAGYSNVEGKYGDYTCTFYNCELDKDGFVIGPGELLNVELLTEEGTPMDLTKLPGEYTVASIMGDSFGPGNWIEGMNYEYYGMYIPLGTYYQTFGEGGSDTHLRGFAQSGSVTVTKVDDGYHFDLDLTVEGGHKLTMSYTAPESSFIDRDAMSNAKANKTQAYSMKRMTGWSPLRDNINNHAASIRMVKRN